MSDAEDLAAQLAEIKATMEQFNETLKPLVAQQQHLRDEKTHAQAVYQASLAKLKQQEYALDENMFQAKTAVNKLNQQAQILTAQFNRAKEAEQAQLKADQLRFEFLAMETAWDRMTAGAPWREWAKDHQISGGHKITADRKVILADPMGLGKTLTSIITLDMVEAATREASPENPFLGEEKQVYTGKGDTGYELKVVNGVIKPCGRKVLYFCPASMIRNVEKEFRIWTKHRNVLFIGGMSRAERAFALSLLKDRTEYTVICNYEAWRKDLSLLDSLVECEFDTVIIDEAHNIKDMSTSAYRGIKKIITELDPPYLLPMTGTPILNKPHELFSLLTLVNPNEFYHLAQFLGSYCEQDDEGKWYFQAGGLTRIAKRISKNFLRRTRDMAGIELPEKTITTHLLPLDVAAYPNQAHVRKEMREHALIMLSETKAIQAAAMIAVFTRLRQIETWPAGIETKDPITKEVLLKVDVEESQKLDYCIAYDPIEKEWNGLIPEFIEEERGVLFSQFKAPLHVIKDRVNRMGKRAVVLDGDTPTLLREEIHRDFDNRYTPDRTKSKWDIVLANYRVGGVGMNLTAATQMVALDEEWSSGKRDQAFDRIHRIGQDKPVTIHIIRTEGTIDDWLANIVEKKENLTSSFNQTMVAAGDFKAALESGLI